MSQVVNILDFAKLGELAISHDTLKIISTIIDIESLSIRSYDKNAVFVESQSFSRRIPRPFRFTISEPKNIDRNKSTITMMELFVDKTALSKFQADLDQAKLFRLNYTFSELIDNIEERQVTTVFIKVYLNICEGPERLLEKSQSLTITVLNSIQRWDGSLRQIHVDDKGAAILCFFGLPPLAHNDDAIRGMKMATEIQTAFKKFQTKFSISVSTGLVSYCGIGCEVRAEYAVVGDAINIAARLMCHELAKDTILCDECTYNLCKQDFKFKEVQDVMLKGRKKPLNVYVPKFSVKSNIDLDSERNIIGRENEKKAINKILESLESANVLEKRSLIISGESGQGLSRLVEYVTQLCLHKNIAH
jgi:class 3 adenylate cyclase